MLGVAVGQLDDAPVARYPPDGTLDPSFGDGGRVTIGPQPLYRPRTAAIQHAGGRPKILLAVAFGRDGIKVVTFPHNSGFCEGMAVAPDGKVVVTVQATTHGGDVGVFRLRRATGAARRQPGATGPGRGLVSRHHGYDWALWPLRSDGRLHSGFGRRGRTVTAMYDDRVAQSFESVHVLAVKPDGGIVATGVFRPWPDGAACPPNTAAATTYSPDGVLDRYFGDHGRAHIPYDVHGSTSADNDPNQVEGADRFAVVRMRLAGQRPGVDR